MTNPPSVTGKEPWLAVILSSLFPGIGQIYAGKITKGVILIGVSLLLLVLAGWAMLSSTGSAVLGFQFLIAFPILVVINLFDAHRSTRQGNSHRFEQLRRSDKDPWLAVFLSKIIPGLGHVYQGQWGYGILFFVALIGINILAEAVPIISLIAIGLLCFCFYHVYTQSPTHRAKSPQLIVKVCLILLAAGILSLVFSISVKSALEARYIPSGAMEPTLQINDRLIINKLSYHLGEPQRGDVVIFWPPESVSTTTQRRDVFIKRIIGLPGDTVEVNNGMVLINGQPLQEAYIKESPSYVWGPEKIPENAYFVLGDNRNNSFDSHAWGFVPRENIIGKASKIFWPPHRSGMIE